MVNSFSIARSWPGLEAIVELLRQVAQRRIMEGDDKTMTARHSFGANVLTQNIVVQPSSRYDDTLKGTSLQGVCVCVEAMLR